MEGGEGGFSDSLVESREDLSSSKFCQFLNDPVDVMANYKTIILNDLSCPSRLDFVFSDVGSNVSGTQLTMVKIICALSKAKVSLEKTPIFKAWVAEILPTEGEKSAYEYSL